MSALPHRYFLVSLTHRPYFEIRSSSFAAQDIIFDYYFGSIDDMSFTSDGKTVAIASSTGLFVFDTTDGYKWVRRLGVPTVTTVTNGVQWSDDGSKLFVCWYENAGSKYRVYDATDWTYPAVNGYLLNYARMCYKNPHKSSFFVASHYGDNTAHWHLTEWDSRSANMGERLTLGLPDTASMPNGYVYNVDWNSDGSLMAVAHNYDSYLSVYDVTVEPYVRISVATNPEGHSNSVKFSPDGTKLAVTHDSGSYFSIYDTTTWGRIPVGGLVSDGVLGMPLSEDTSTLEGVFWQTNDTLVLFGNNFPGIIDYNVTTKKFTGAHFQNSNRFYHWAMPEPLYEVTGTITESTLVPRWAVTAIDYDTGQPFARIYVDAPDLTFSIGCYNPSQRLSITVEPEVMDAWERHIVAKVGRLILPKDPTSTPYYYKCTTAGLGGLFEPIWDVTPLNTVIDGDIVWECVERIIQPITQAPLIARRK